MKRLLIILVLLLLFVAAFWFFGCQPATQPPAVVVQSPQPAQVAPPAVTPPAPKLMPVPPTAIRPPPWSPPPVPVIVKVEKVVTLNRADWSGIYVLPKGVTWQNVIELYRDGKPVDRGRICKTHPDEVDIFDARLASIITARILQ
jgi:hypothetical protein